MHSLSVCQVATVVVSLLPYDPAILRYHILLQHVFRWDSGERARHVVPRRECMPRTKISHGTFTRQNPVRLACPGPFCMAGATFLAHTTAVAEPTDARKREILVAPKDSVYPQLFWAGVFVRTLYLHNLIRSGKVRPFRAGKQSRTVWHRVRACGVRRPDGGGTMKKPMLVPI